MVVRANETNKTVKIWVDNSEKDTYMCSSEYRKAIDGYKNTHRICVLVGGTLPIVPTIDALLEVQNSIKVYA